MAQNEEDLSTESNRPIHQKFWILDQLPLRPRPPHRHHHHHQHRHSQSNPARYPRFSPLTYPQALLDSLKSFRWGPNTETQGVSGIATGSEMQKPVSGPADVCSVQHVFPYGCRIHDCFCTVRSLCACRRAFSSAATGHLRDLTLVYSTEY